MSFAELISKYIYELKYENLPEEVIELAKAGIMDWLGVAVGGANHEGVLILKDLIKESGGNQESTVIAQNMRTSAPWAALINGTTAHVLDFDDTHEDSILHATTPILSAAVSLGEKFYLSGRDLILSYICGFEISTRLGRAIMPSHFERGSHPTGTLGTIGAAVACSKLLGLTPTQIIHALGIAATQAAGVREVFGTMCKSFHAGRAAQSGVLAASLAAKGFTSSERALDGGNGFFNVLSDRKGKINLVTDDLGDRFLIKQNIFKAYASCLQVHAAIDCMLKLRDSYDLKPENVEKITAYVFHFAPDAAGIENPKTGLEAKFSLKHCIALALVKGAVRQSFFTDDIVNDPELKKTRKKIEIEVDSDLIMTKARMVVRMSSGIEYTVSVDGPKGSPMNPMTKNELIDKFTDLVGTAPKIKAHAVIDCINRLEFVEDIRDLMSLVINS
ncbi:MAG: MmgE/PrpD family protein [Deltaproteobacteria bacterium]|nr:MAG: MmgE/PrpD family protein [Deltaproteobacteria bacterium]